MTLALAKNCKMTKKSDIDDVINTSKMSDKTQKTFFVIRTRLGDCTYQVSNPYKVFHLVAVANMSEKTPQDLWGGVVHLPFWGAMESTFHSSEK